jgi:asparagine synthase (glutamine-hydrolysing)
MTGFMGILSEEKKQLERNFDVAIPSITPRIEDKKIIGNCWFKRSIINKFINDKIFVDKSDLFICIDGTILNAASLMDDLKVMDIFYLIQNLYNRDSSAFPSQLRGDFSGVIYDKRQDSWIIFNNHIGSKPVFYYFDEIKGDFIFGSEFQMVLSGMKSIGCNSRISEMGAYCLLSFGYMLGNHTLVEGIKRLPPGSILRYQQGRISIVQYYQLKNTPYIDLPDDQIIRELDTRFRAAIRAEYEKDLEYGYNHIATLSGGLDSRMNVCYGKKLNFASLLTICFSQGNYADEKIAKQIASDWGYEFLFSSLDNGNYLKEIETHVRVNDGLTYYSGAAHVYSMLHLINWTQFGLLHTGQLGDAIMGTYLLVPKHQDINESIANKFATSIKLREHLPREILSHIENAYPNDELFAFYERGVNGIFNGYRVIEQFSEFSSPFLYLDFLEYAMRIPPKKRYREKIYLDWIQKKAPETTGYLWEKTGLLITAGRLRIIIRNVIKNLKRKIRGPSPKDSMIPFDYWYETNSDLRSSFEDYYTRHISLLNDHPSLKEDAKYLFEQGNTLEKTQVLTLLAAIKLHKLRE